MSEPRRVTLNSMSPLESQQDNISAERRPKSVVEQRFAHTDHSNIYQQTERLLSRAVQANHSTLIMHRAYRSAFPEHPALHPSGRR